jgi:hypothetical protein
MADTEQRPAYVAAHIDDIPFEDGEAPKAEWKPIRRFFGIGSFGVNLARAVRAGDELTHDHDEVDSGHEELFLIAAGHATYRVAGDEVDAPAGTFLYVSDPATVRGAVARAAGTVMLVVGAAPGTIFAPSEWDTEPLPE